MYKNLITIVISSIIGLLLVYLFGILYFYTKVSSNKINQQYQFKNIESLNFHKKYSSQLHHLKGIVGADYEKNLRPENYLFNVVNSFNENKDKILIQGDSYVETLTYYNKQNDLLKKFSIDECTHSFFGVSKTYADLIVQEYGKNVGLKTVCFRSGCITGPNHSGAKLHGFLSYLVKLTLSKKKYSIIGYKGKQVRDNLHSYELVNCFWHFFKKPRVGEIYNMGGGRHSNCSIIEALDIVENLTGFNINKQKIRAPRIGDHIWYISSLKKFKKHYPKWKQKYNTKKIIEELIENYR